MVIVYGCRVENFDASTQTCTVPEWVMQPGLLPPLPVAQGLAVSGAIITVVATAAALRMVRRQIWAKA